LNAHPRYESFFAAPLGMLRLFGSGLRQGVLVKDVAPAGVSLGGVFLLHFGLWQTVLLNQLSLVGGMLSVQDDGRRG
jgi:hypothetical protein